MKPLLITFFFFLFTSCQKELNFPKVEVVLPVIETRVSSIVITYGYTDDYDSIVYKYSNDKTREIHYNYAGDSTTRTYYYDALQRLSRIEDNKAIYYTNNDIAKSISFFYDTQGELTETSSDFGATSGVKAYYNHNISGGTKRMLIYDTSYRGSSYDLDWANRIIYLTLKTDNTLLYDSCIYINYASGHIKKTISSYNYNGDKEPASINKFTYQDEELSEWGTTIIERDKPAPVFEALRKKLYHNLADWYQASSAMQNDSYQPFSVPGGMLKSTRYKGTTILGLALSQNIIISQTYDNSYSSDVLQRSVVTYDMTGEGSTHYDNYIKYYYTQ
jgi:hypothetical protein